MKRLLLAGAALLAIAMPANAVIINAGDVGASGSTTIQGLVNANVQPGLTGSLFLEFDGVSNGGLTWNFDYTLTNTSSAPITGSRISSFGLNTTPNISSATSTGVYGFPDLSPNGVPGYIGTVEFCFGSSANGCTGGNGLTIGQSASGEFSLTFGSVLSSISLDAAYGRFQSISGSPYGDSGAGLNTNPNITTFAVPGPIVGAGLPGLIAGCLSLLGLARWRKNKAAVA